MSVMRYDSDMERETNSALSPLTTTDVEVSTTANPELVAGAWLASLRSENTQAAYRRDLTRFFDWLGENGLDPWAVQRRHIDLWVLSLDLSPATVARRLASVASFYNYAMDESIIANNPAERVKRPKVSPESGTAWLSAEEVGRFIDAARENARDYATSWLLALGLRVQEVCDANAEDLTNRQGHRLLNVTGKGGRLRSVPLPPSAVDAIEMVLDGRESGPLSPSLSGEPQNRHQITRMVKRLARAASLDVRTTTPHVLRHSAAVAMLSTTRDIRATQRALGHASADTTERYLHSIEDLDSSPVYAAALAYSS